MAGGGDSFFEYVIKYWVATDKANDGIGKWYYEMAESFIDNLGIRFNHSGQFAFYERDWGFMNPKFGHLACFSGGMYALGAMYSTNETIKVKHMEVAKGIGAFCKAMYDHSNVTGLPYEAIGFDESGNLRPYDSNNRYYIQRPEAVETWFYLWRMTKDPIYRKWGWEFYESIEAHTRKPYGYTGLRNGNDPSTPDDHQQSFFLAETIKYLYLLFCPDDIIPLDKFVFNTEAHPFTHFEAMYQPSF